MTASRRPGRIAIIDDDDLFARGPDDELLHVHNEFDTAGEGVRKAGIWPATRA